MDKAKLIDILKIGKKKSKSNFYEIDTNFEFKEMILLGI